MNKTAKRRGKCCGADEARREAMHGPHVCVCGKVCCHVWEDVTRVCVHAMPGQSSSSLWQQAGTSSPFHEKPVPEVTQVCLCLSSQWSRSHAHKNGQCPPHLVWGNAAAAFLARLIICMAGSPPRVPVPPPSEGHGEWAAACRRQQGPPGCCLLRGK